MEKKWLQRLSMSIKTKSKWGSRQIIGSQEHQCSRRTFFLIFISYFTSSLLMIKCISWCWPRHPKDQVWESRDLFPCGTKEEVVLPPPRPFSLQWLGDPELQTAGREDVEFTLITGEFLHKAQTQQKDKSELPHDTLFNLTSVSEETCVKKCLSIFHSSKSTQALANPTM